MPAPEYTTDRRKALCVWLQANGIEPNQVPIDSDLYIEDSPDGRQIHHELYVLDNEGRKTLDVRGNQAARENASTPLTVEPPDWWEPYVKPGRDDLLQAVDKVLALHADEDGICTGCTGLGEAYVQWPCPTITALGDIARA